MSDNFPPDASLHAVQADAAFRFLAVASTAALLLICGLAVLYVVRYRRGDESQQGAEGGRVNPAFVTVWVLAALGLAILAGKLNFSGYVDSLVAPRDAVEIDVTARMWNWDFTYPNGETTDSLHVAQGRPVRLNLHTEDVVHSLAIPALRLKREVVPGRAATAWFRADRPDTYALRSHSFSGDGFGDMKAALIVHPPEAYDAFMETLADIFEGRTLEEVGEIIYTKLSCKTCHTLDGTRLVGPSLRDVYGNTFATTSGERVVVDDAYVRESILDPGASLIEGYDNLMTPYANTIEDREIEAIIAWLKTISSYSGQEGN